MCFLSFALQATFKQLQVNAQSGLLQRIDSRYEQFDILAPMNQNQLSIRRQCIADRASRCQDAQSDLAPDESTVVVFQHAEQTAASGGTDRHVGLEEAVHWTDPPHLRRRTHDRHPRQQLVVAITGSGVEHGPVADGRIDRLLGRHLASRGRVRRHPADA